MEKVGRIHVLIVGLAAGAPGCGGLFLIDAEGQCEGPYCDESCDQDTDCPDGSRCIMYRCSTAGMGSGGAGGGGGSGGIVYGDPVIMLDDGRITYGDVGYPPGDAGPGDALGFGDYVGGGDLGPGDTPPPGDTTLTGDVLVTGDSGVVCFDPDLDGYCECCPSGPDCPAAGCPSGNPGCGEYNAGVNPGVTEICDMVDNNCDGEIDEGVTNNCGTCAPADFCIEDTPWTVGAGGGGGTGGDAGNLPGPDADPTPGNCIPDCVVIDGVIAVDDDGDGFGAITLAGGTVATDFAYGANEIEGTVSRVDTIRGQEVGRYATVVWRSDDFRRPYVQPWGPSGSRCAEPSRTTINGDGNAFVANRAVSGYDGACTNETTEPRLNGSVTMIAYFNATTCDHTQNSDLVGCQCIDSNGNGVIETSFDHDASRSIDVTGATQSGCVTLDPSQVPHEVPNGDTCSTSCVTDADCVAALGERHFCVGGACSDLPQRAEFLSVDDECLMWTLRIPGDDTNATPNGDNASSPRGMAVDRDGYVWVGDDHGDTAPWYLYKIHPEPPSTLHPRGRGLFVCPHAAGCCRDGDDCAGGDVPIPWNAECPLTPRDEDNRAVVRADPATECTPADPCAWTVDSTCRVAVTARPYGAVIDSGESHPNGFGYLWATRYHEGWLQRVDTQTGAVSRRFRATNGSSWGSAYGITIDHEDRPWIVQSHTTTLGTLPVVMRFNATTRDVNGNLVENFVPGTVSDPDPSAALQAPLWSIFAAETGTIPDGRTSPWGTTNWHGRGITTELLPPANPGDPVTSRIWANFNNGWSGDDNWILAFDSVSGAELTLLRTNASPGDSSDPCRDPIGIGMGYEQKVWVVNQNSWSMCAFDPADTSGGQGMARLHVAPIGPKPYTYSDFTGSIYRSFTNPEGRYKVLVRACPEDYDLVRWGSFGWEAELPGESVLEVKFRFGNTVFEAMDLAGPQTIGQVQTGPLPPPESFTWTPDPYETRIYCEVEFRFLADNQGLAPILYTIDAARNCIPPG